MTSVMPGPGRGTWGALRPVALSGIPPHTFHLFTLAWGAAYLAEAAARLIIAETASTGTALTVSKMMPYAVGAVLVGWMIVYGRHAQRKGEKLALS